MEDIFMVKNVTKDFTGLRALSDVCFSVRRGGVHGLIGPNGSGKSTMFNVITGVYPATSGEILRYGESISGLTPHQVSSKGIGRTFQNIRLFSSLTVEDNIKISVGTQYKLSFVDVLLRTPKERRTEKEIQEKTDALMVKLGLSNVRKCVASSLPYGRQRVMEIARAWGVEPTLMLLDEPGAGMNDKDKELLLDVIQKLTKDGVTVLLVEHDMKLVMKVTQHITVLDSGIKIAEGTPKEIANNPEVIKAYLGEEALC
jgi:branched-chain amino acid transport system ATP-binding protein